MRAVTHLSTKQGVGHPSDVAKHRFGERPIGRRRARPYFRERTLAVALPCSSDMKGLIDAPRNAVDCNDRRRSRTCSRVWGDRQSISDSPNCRLFVCRHSGRYLHAWVHCRPGIGQSACRARRNPTDVGVGLQFSLEDLLSVRAMPYPEPSSKS